MLNKYANWLIGIMMGLCLCYSFSYADERVGPGDDLIQLKAILDKNHKLHLSAAKDSWDYHTAFINTKKIIDEHGEIGVLAWIQMANELDVMLSRADHTSFSEIECQYRMTLMALSCQAELEEAQRLVKRLKTSPRGQ